MAAKIFRINYKSDFILTLNSDAGWMTPFCIKFWTGAPSRAYYAGWDGTTYTNCAPVAGEPTKLVVQFDDHHLPVGDLKLQIAYHFTVADFPNDTEDEVINPAAITTMIDGEEYQVMLDFTGETAPEIQFSLPAYANEAQRIANEQERQREFAQMQEENAQAVEGAENVNATLNGNTLTVTNREGQSTSVNTKGEAGHGVPAGGLTGQMLFKKSDDDYDTDWQDPHAAGVNSVNGKTGDVTLNASDVGALPSDTPIPTVPTNVSAFNNDAGYITKTVNDLVNYYLKADVYTKTEVANLIAAIQQFHYEIYASISAVTSPAGNVLYLIGPTGTGSDKYEEYVYDSTKQEPWVKIGDTSIDLSGYYTKGQTDSAITSALNTALANYTTTTALTQLLAGKQDVINDLSDIRSGASAGATAYQKPAGGIPKSDLAQGVKDSLNKADTALQEDTLYVKVNNNGHEYVDLGLPSGTLWAKCNVGADAETGYGNYYMYGKGARQYNSSDSPYTGTEDPLDLSVDTARQVLGGSWKMPTQVQMQELIDNTTYEFTTINGVNGAKFTALNGNYVFFPAAGYWDNFQYGVGSGGDYWGSSPEGSYGAYYLNFDNGSKGIDGGIRHLGCSVRGIILPEKTQLKQDLDNKQNTLVSGTNIKTLNGESILGSGNINIDISGKEDKTAIEAPVNQTDATLPITTLATEVGKYYRIDVPVETLAVTLPVMENITTTKTVVLYLTGGTTPAVTITSIAPTGGSAPDVYFSDGFAIESGKTYEVNCLWNGASWIVASVEIVTNNGGE